MKVTKIGPPPALEPDVVRVELSRTEAQILLDTAAGVGGPSGTGFDAQLTLSSTTRQPGSSSFGKRDIKEVTAQRDFLRTLGHAIEAQMR